MSTMSEKIPGSAPALNHSHWGTFEPVVVDGRVTEARPFARDPDPSPLLHSIPDALHHASRVAQPAVRAGWLEHGPGGARDRRGADRYVAVTWERALDLVADELKRVIRDRGNHAIYAGSYGWASAGRFHHARTQLQRFLGGIGGFTGARDTYSNAAGAVLVKNVLGSLHAMNGPGTSWKSIADHADLVVMFGGIPTRNTQVTPGGVGEHTTRGWLERVKAAGVEFCNISPMRDDAAAFLDAEWIAPRPHSDTALMLALAHTLIVEGLHDADFLARYCTGFNRFRDYLLGDEDGVAKSAEWAAGLSEISADKIRSLARKMAASRTFINVNWSLQRGDHGEQPVWAAIALAAVLGQVGLPGGGFGFGYGSMEGLATMLPDMPIPTLPLGHNPVRSFIPVARIADLLLNPGQPFQYNGQDLIYPDIDLVYWCGGNPFHHHQDHQPPDPRVAPAFDDHRPRSVVDRDRAPCRHRAADDHDARARRHRRQRARQIHHRDEAGDRAGRRSARRLCNLQRSRGSLRHSRVCSPKAAPPFNGCVISTTPRANTRIVTWRSGPPSTSSGSAAISKFPKPRRRTCCSRNSG